MRRIAPAIVALTLVVVPAAAEDQPPSAEEGLSLLEEGARIILRSLMDEMEPRLKEMHEGLGAAMEEMGPALRKLAGMIDDIRNYEMPEMLPNGDIIIRRKPPEDPLVPGPTPGPNGEIEL